jgi:hypothetical protein
MFLHETHGYYIFLSIKIQRAKKILDSKLCHLKSKCHLWVGKTTNKIMSRSVNVALAFHNQHVYMKIILIFVNKHNNVSVLMLCLATRVHGRYNNVGKYSEFTSSPRVSPSTSAPILFS